MTKTPTNLPGCFVLEPRIFSDHRGDFIKIFNADVFQELGLNASFKEEYYSTSKKGVLRGLHFQVPPSAHVKCIICLQGEIFDVVVDLRKESPTYGKHFTIHLKASEPKVLYIPEGMAHGFLSLTNDTLFLNKTTTVFDGPSDKGIRWDSCGINWPSHSLILSGKDEELPGFNEFNSPF
jgi:dTDP-4-dehydrorhamnose 3,5-epimerase